VLRSKRRGWIPSIVKVGIAIPLFALVALLLFRTISDPYEGSTFSIVASAVVIAGLATDELIGNDVRALLGM
jgi:hypothetical protein